MTLRNVFLSVIIFAGLAMQAKAQTGPQIGVTLSGDYWFQAPSGTLVVFMADGRVLRNGAVLITCDPAVEINKTIGKIIASCEDGEIDVVDRTHGAPEIFTLDDEEITLATPNAILTREIAGLNPVPAPDGAMAAPATTESSAEEGTAAQPAAECVVPVGTYRYLAGDRDHAFYTRADYTLRIAEGEGVRIAAKGDFNVRVGGATYVREGSTFRFRNEIGTYTQSGTGEIVYDPSPAFARVARLAPIGTSQTDDYGTYTKMAADRIVFVSRFRRDDLLVTKDNCSTFQTAAFAYEDVVANLGVTREGSELVINLASDILFDFDSAEITPAAGEILAQLAFLIMRDAKDEVRVHGHTDAKGSDGYNMTLSIARAEAVKSWLTSRGKVDNVGIETIGHGENQPMAPNTRPDGSDDPEGRALNRRVEVRFDG